MKMLLLKTILLSYLLLFSVSLNAQNKDYIITNIGDTIRCSITGPSMFNVYKYKVADNNEFVKIKEQNVKEFYQAEKNILFRLVYIENNAQPTFMLVLENGKISLYQVIIEKYSITNTAAYNSNTEWFVSKGSNIVTLLKYNGTANLNGFKGRKKRKNDFAEMLQDNEEVHSKYMAEDDFSFEQLRSLIHLYNTGEPLKK